MDEVGWHISNSDDETKPAGQKRPNELGIYDMSGNVWEWCNDWYAAYPAGAVKTPSGAVTGDERVIRGGSFSLNPRFCRVASRFSVNPSAISDNLGFRAAFIRN